MKKLLIALTAAAATVTTCSVTPAHADDVPGWEVMAPAEAGKIDAGWARVSCNGTTENQRCHLRFPDGFRRLRVTYVHGGDSLGTLGTWDHDTPTRRRDGVRKFDRRIVSGVRVACSTTGATVDCTVSIRERVRVFEDTYWSAGWNMGGIIYEADLPAETQIGF